jgi:hypothetical protein
MVIKDIGLHEDMETEADLNNAKKRSLGLRKKITQPSLNVTSTLYFIKSVTI